MLARDTLTGKERVVEMKSAVDVNDADVQKMVEESVEHAFEDLAVRRWVEAKLTAEQTLKATRVGLEQCGSELTPDQRTAIEGGLQAVDHILSSEDPATQSGDAKKLKEAHAQLDEATRPLAEIMMDRAMDAMLRKRGVI